MTTTLDIPTTAGPDLSLARLHAMRGGYLLMGVGLALVKWPKLPSAHNLPVYEGVTLCLLTAMSLLALLGLRYPVKMLPVLLFEAVWKALWFAVVALPRRPRRRSRRRLLRRGGQLLPRHRHHRRHPVAPCLGQLREDAGRSLAWPAMSGSCRLVMTTTLGALASPRSSLGPASVRATRPRHLATPAL